jgi:sigma-B regulation protein RsbU (phosphoserine phosphatase)
VTTDADAHTLAMVRTFLDRAHLATPGQLSEVALEAVRELGWTAQMYLADYEQQSLVPVPVTGMAAATEQSIDGTLAGRCFRTVEPVPSVSGERAVWLPLVDGAERLGVLQIVVRPEDELDDPRLEERCRLLGHLLGHLIAAKRPYGDALDALMRRRPRTVASELLHQLLPPLTFACEGLVVSGILQPFYDVAADAFDYSVVDDTAHLVILDATGHDLHGTTLAAVALSCYRNSRRQGHGIFSTAQAMDELIAEHGEGWRLATGVLGELNLTSGRFRYLNAGHPPPLLMRDGKVVKELTEGHRVLLGGGEGEGTIAEEWLQSGDRVVLYTDGITEARTEDGEFFGVERLIDHLERAATTRQPAAETLRRISHDVRAHQGGALADDATLLIAEWATGKEHSLTSSWNRTLRPEELSPRTVLVEDQSADAPRR